MNSHHSPSLGLRYTDAALSRPRHDGASPVATDTSATRADRHQRAGERMILAGFVIAIVGVVAYCVASFAAGMSPAMDDILFRNDVPFVRATLVVLGVGTLVWLAGSIRYLKGALDADEEAGRGVDAIDQR